MMDEDRGTLRAREVGDRERKAGSETSDSPVPSAEGGRAPRARITRERASLVHHLGREWDTLVWVVAAFAVLYYTEFASTLLFDSRVKGRWLYISIASFLGCGSCLLYAFTRRNGLHPNNWQRTAPVLVPIATVAGLAGEVGLAVAVWSVWHFYTIPILFTLFMGFVATVSLLGL